MQPVATEPDLRSYIQLLRRRKWWVVVVVVLGLASALGLSFAQSDKYSATAQVLLQPSGSNSALLGASAGQSLTPTDISTEIQLVNSADVRFAVAKSLGVARAPVASASEDGTTNIIDITAIASSPARAAAVANAYSDAYIGVRASQTVTALLALATQVQSKVAALQASIKDPKTSAAVSSAEAAQLVAYQAEEANLQIASSSANGGPVPSSPAVAPTKPSSPRPTRNAVIGVVVGLLLGTALAFLVEHLDDTVKTRDDLVTTAPDLPVVGLIPAVDDWKDRRSPILESVNRPRSHASEAYKTLRTSVQFLALEKPLGVLLVTSASAAEGKTTTLANLAVATAQAGHRVIVVCCDLRRPRLHEFFGLTHEVGLTSVLLGEASLSAALQEVPGVEGLSLLAAGPLPPNPAELLSSPRTAEVLRSLRAQADLVLLDSPPVLPVTDALILSDQVDAVLLVATAKTTTRRDLARAVEILGQVRAPLLGTVLNGVSGDGTYGAGGYGYAYGYSYGAGSKRSKATNGTTANGSAANGRAAKEVVG